MFFDPGIANNYSPACNEREDQLVWGNPVGRHSCTILCETSECLKCGIFLKVHKFFLKMTKTKNKTNVVSFIFICIFVDFVIKLSSLKVHKYVQLSIKCVFTSFVFPDQLSNKILENCVQRTMFIDLNNVQRMVFIEISLHNHCCIFGCSTAIASIQINNLRFFFF